jgi:uncharacterized damage-inducible protein DinB
VSTAQALIAELKLESVSTRRMLERVPQASLTWKPHAKSRSLGEIASHVANIPGVFLATLGEDDCDREAYRSAAPLDSASGIVEAFDRNVAGALEVLGTIPEEVWMKPWRYRYGSKVIFELPRIAAARAMGLNHLIHHRGQLSVYLRLLDIPLPPVYGPTADEALPP